MQYVNPLANPGPGNTYRDRNIGAGFVGSIPSGVAIEHPLRELDHLIAFAGLVPSGVDLTQVRQAIQAMIAGAIGSPLDTPFMAGWGGDFAGEDLAVQGYGAVIFGRNATLTGDIGKIVTGPVGADLLLDFEVDGVSIYATRPKFTDGGVIYTAGILTNVNGVDVNTGQVGIFKVEQIGIATPGQKLAWTVKGKVR